MKALPLFQHFQGAFVRVRNRVFQVPVVHLQCDRKQRTREMIQNRDCILSFHGTILPTPSLQATDPRFNAERIASPGLSSADFLCDM